MRQGGKWLVSLKKKKKNRSVLLKINQNTLNSHLCKKTGEGEEKKTKKKTKQACHIFIQHEALLVRAIIFFFFTFKINIIDESYAVDAIFNESTMKCFRTINLRVGE